MVQQLTIDELRELEIDTLSQGAGSLKEELEARGYNVISDKGTFAVVVEKKGEPDRVLRISKDFWNDEEQTGDAWVHFALKSQGSRFAPRVDAFGAHDGLWYAIVERLEPWDPQVQTWFFDMYAKMQSGCAWEEDPVWLDLCENWPGLAEFREEHFPDEGRYDINYANVMLRGGNEMVFNDPYRSSSLTAEIREEILRNWTIELESSLEETPQP